MSLSSCANHSFVVSWRCRMSCSPSAVRFCTTWTISNCTAHSALVIQRHKKYFIQVSGPSDKQNKQARRGEWSLRWILRSKLSDEGNQALQEFLIARNPRQQHSSTLESYLIKPIQRILKYPLLLQQLRNLTSPQADEHIHLVGECKVSLTCTKLVFTLTLTKI